MFAIIKNGGVNIRVSDRETDAVKIAAGNLRTDLKKAARTHEGNDAEIIIGTVGVSDIIGEYVTAEEIGTRKETYLHKIVDGKLIIAGTDRRGTIYGIYEFSESIGVSPWYFFADVPVKERDKIELADDYFKKDYPTVEYRGIFINDEEELEHWVTLNMGEDTIGVKTYEKIFELLLRLKANYIWPAMHVNSFNVKRENGALADKMGIVVGTSHCDMLMRSNNREWLPWLKENGYEGTEYDYSLGGQNREILKKYWRDSIEQNKDFEVSYTLGMRGIHDSGFETRALADLKGEELQKAKIALLEKIIADQKEMLSDVLGRDTMKTFVPYKEVLNLYDAGLNVPEDLTLIWSNDNYGYIRRYPDEREKARRGGNGIYYHNSYWAPANASYLFINTIPLAHTKNELKKAFSEGVRKLWVLNVGAIKPLEPEIDFFLRYAWEITKETTTADAKSFVEQLINKNFSGGHGAECAEIFNDFDSLANVRKAEFLDNGVFSLSAYGDEWSDRINKLRDLYDRANAVYERIPDDEKDAFYQLFLMKIHAGYFMNAQYYYADRSVYCHDRGMLTAAQKYTEESRRYDDEKRKLIEYYNHKLSGGRWNGILMPETFPPPVNAMDPICRPPIDVPEKSDMIVSVWGDENQLVFTNDKEKWIDIAPSGAKPVPFEIAAPEWVNVSRKSGEAEYETRVFISAKRGGRSGEIIVSGADSVVAIPICSAFSASENAEDGGIISVEANSGRGEGWTEIPNLGRGEGSLMEAAKPGGALKYSIHLKDDSQAPVLEIHRFPSLNSTGRIRVGVSADGGEAEIVESDSNDEHKGRWSSNVFNNVDKLYLALPSLSAGEHEIALTAVDKYFAFSRFAVYTRKRRENNMGMQSFGAALPERIVNSFYDIELMPRPTVYARKNPPENTLLSTNETICADCSGGVRDIREIISTGNQIFRAENNAVKIDAAAALSDSAFASAGGGVWNYCAGECFGGSSAAIYAEGTDIKADIGKAPYISYMIDVKSGLYTVWTFVKITRRGNDYIALSVDGAAVAEEKLYNGGKLWRYENEQIWFWVPAAEIALTEGIHTIKIYSRTSGIRFDRIYITSGDELPPPDGRW